MVASSDGMTVFVVSDGTGDTGSAAVRAAMIQFRNRWRLRVFRDARTISEVRRVIEQAEEIEAQETENISSKGRGTAIRRVVI
jgi:regulator of PEP synthase PpsR (kinase-PPPase family)